MPRRNVGFVKPPEPSFITRMKQEIGFKEGPTVDTKRERDEDDELADDRGDDEAPTVVVLRDGDLTAEQAARELDAASTLGGPRDADDQEPAGGRIIFRKPSSSKRNEEPSRQDELNADGKRHRGEHHDKKATKKKKPNTKLLSFQHDDEEEEG